MTSTTTQTSNLWPPLLQFSLAYILLSALITAILFIFDLNANTGEAIGTLMGATVVGARKFVIDHSRAMQGGEQLRFSLLAFAAIILITIAQFLVTVALVIGKDEMSAAYDEAKAALAGNAVLFSSIVVIVMLVYFAILYFSSGWFSRMFAKRLAATGKI
jgi:uncharacterized membrane protein